MTQFAWEPEFAIGHAEIDSQHRKIIDILNNLYALLSKKSDEFHAKTELLFDELAEYVSTHFAYEEELMLNSGYPPDDFAAHKHIHNTLLAQVQRIALAHHDGDESALSELLPFLYGNWLIDHICGTDRLYADCVC